MKIQLSKAREQIKALKLDPASLKKRLQNRSVVSLTFGSSECTVRVVRREQDRIWPAKTAVLPRSA